MKKLQALLRGEKFTDKLLELKEKEINRKLEAYKDEQETEKANAEIEYEKLLHSLACPQVDYKSVLCAMVECKQRIIDASRRLRRNRRVAASQGVLAAVGYAECTRPDGSKSEVNCYSAFSAESA